MSGDDDDLELDPNADPNSVYEVYKCGCQYYGGDLDQPHFIRCEEHEDRGPDWYWDDDEPDRDEVELADPDALAQRLALAITAEIRDREAKAQKLPGDVLALQERRAALQEQIAELEDRRRECERRLAEYPDVEDALAVMSGEITHLLVRDIDGRPKVQTVADAMRNNDDRSGRRMRLLTLSPTVSGRGRGGIAWSLNTYHDGSGNDMATVLCRSEDEARQALRAAFVEDVGKVEGWLKGQGDVPSRALRSVSHWQHYLDQGIPAEDIPTSIVRQVNAEASKDQRRRTEEAKDRYERALQAEVSLLPVTEPS